MRGWGPGTEGWGGGCVWGFEGKTCRFRMLSRDVQDSLFSSRLPVTTVCPPSTNQDRIHPSTPRCASPSGAPQPPTRFWGRGCDGRAGAGAAAWPWPFHELQPRGAWAWAPQEELDQRGRWDVLAGQGVRTGRDMAGQFHCGGGGGGDGGRGRGSLPGVIEGSCRSLGRSGRQAQGRGQAWTPRDKAWPGLVALRCAGPEPGVPGWTRCLYQGGTCRHAGHSLPSWRQEQGQLWSQLHL